MLFRQFSGYQQNQRKIPLFLIQIFNPKFYLAILLFLIQILHHKFHMTIPLFLIQILHPKFYMTIPLFLIQIVHPKFYLVIPLFLIQIVQPKLQKKIRYQIPTLLQSHSPQGFIMIATNSPRTSLPTCYIIQSRKLHNTTKLQENMRQSCRHSSPTRITSRIFASGARIFNSDGSN